MSQGKAVLGRVNCAPAPQTLAAMAITATMLWASVAIARLGVAEYLALTAIDRIGAWKAEQRPLPEGMFTAIELRLQRAASLVPDAAAYYEMRAAMYFSRAEDFSRGATKQEADYKMAAALYREATLRIRASGYAWGNYMLAKHRSGEIDADFVAALRSAVRLAPFEANVQAMVAEAGLSNWDQLPLDAQQAVARIVHNGWDKNRVRILAEAAAAAPQRAHWCHPLGLAAADLLLAMRRLCAASASLTLIPLGLGQDGTPQ